MNDGDDDDVGSLLFIGELLPVVEVRLALLPLLLLLFESNGFILFRTEVAVAPIEFIDDETAAFANEALLSMATLTADI